eukprot:4119035-Pyramimonas_sp.AAC.1
MTRGKGGSSGARGNSMGGLASRAAGPPIGERQFPWREDRAARDRAGSRRRSQQHHQHDQRSVNDRGHRHNYYHKQYGKTNSSNENEHHSYHNYDSSWKKGSRTRTTSRKASRTPTARDNGHDVFDSL